jgi:hypothetical protein
MNAYLVNEIYFSACVISLFQFVECLDSTNDSLILEEYGDEGCLHFLGWWQSPSPGRLAKGSTGWIGAGGNSADFCQEAVVEP